MQMKPNQLENRLIQFSIKWKQWTDFNICSKYKNSVN